MDPLWLSIAFAAGFLVRQVGLPPLVGFLVAGFILKALGAEAGETLETVSDFGVLLLLFSIGLKLKLGSLLKPEVWAGASLHMLVTTGLFSLVVYGFGIAGMPFFSQLEFPLALLIAFALSFSSTVFAVKVLEEKGEMGSLHGRVAIGILIMQDIFAVVFLTVTGGKSPSIWALALPLILWGIRPALFRIMDRCDHGELLILFGMFCTLVVGAAGFDAFGLKPDLGALVIGIMLAGHMRSSELAKTLMGFKDLFLVGFFLSIGLSGTPSLAAVGVAALLVVAVPFKVALFMLLLTRFKLRSRSALLGSLSLANYSEFGLIVGTVGAKSGWISGDWLVIIAIALSITFILAAPLNSFADSIYERYRTFLLRFQRSCRHPDDQPIAPDNNEVAIFGMGRIGTAAYEFMQQQFPGRVVGVDHDEDTVRKHIAEQRKVIYGDPTDPDFWARITPDERRAKMVMLAMSKHAANLAAARHLKELGYTGTVTATAHFADHADELAAYGVEAFNFYAEAGTGFAEHSWELMNAADPDNQSPETA